MTTASKEFTIGLSNVEGCQKYTPRTATFNGIKGRIWTKRKFTNGAWLHEGKQHVRNVANETEVTAAFDGGFADHDIVDGYWNQACR